MKANTEMHKEYKRPPITEAVIAMHFVKDIRDKDIEVFSAKSSATYKTRQDAVYHDIKLGAGAPEIVQAKQVRLISEDETKIAILRHSTISICNMPPYANWGILFDDFEKAALRIDKICTPKFKPPSCRFINRIDIPHTGNSPFLFEEFFAAGIYMPQIYTNLAIDNLNYTTVLRIPQEEAKVIINFTMAPPAIIDHISFVLDFDVVSEKPIKNVDDVIQTASKLRDIKNSFFEGFLTEKAKELFE